MNQEKLVALLLEQFSGEEGLNCNTGSRLTMKPLAPLPRFSKRPVVAPRSKSRKKRPIPAA